MTHATPARSPGRHTPGTVRRWAARRPLAAFSLLVFGVGWPALAALARSRHGHGPGGGVVYGRAAEEWLGLGLTAAILLPSALAVTWAADGAAGVRALVRRAFRWRVGVGWGVTVVVGLPAVAIALALAAGGRWRGAPGPSLAAAYAGSLLTRTLVVNLWEELAWAGVVQTRLQERYGTAAAALLTAVPFAAVHVPFQFMGDAPLPLFSAGLLVLAAVFRLLVGVVLAGTGGSVLAAGVLHAAFNTTNYPEGVLHAVVASTGLSWQALAAALLLPAGLGLHRALRAATRPARPPGRAQARALHDPDAA